MLNCHVLFVENVTMHRYGDIMDLKGVSHTTGETDAYESLLIIVSLNLMIL